MSETTVGKPAGGDTQTDEQKKPRDDERTGDKANPANGQGEIEGRLDEALEETFPSSDPVSVKITK